MRVADGEVFAFAPNLQPVAAFRPGEVFQVECQDSCGGQIRSEADALAKIELHHVNGATGARRLAESSSREPESTFGQEERTARERLRASGNGI